MSAYYQGIVNEIDPLLPGIHRYVKMVCPEEGITTKLDVFNLLWTGYTRESWGISVEIVKITFSVKWPEDGCFLQFSYEEHPDGSVVYPVHYIGPALAKDRTVMRRLLIELRRATVLQQLADI